MNRLAGAIVVVGSIAFCRSAPAEDWADRLQVTAEAGDEGRVSLILEATSGWYVNTAYPGTKVLFKVPEGAQFEKTEIKKDEATFEGATEGDKARSVRFTASVKGKTPQVLEGTYKTVVCSKTTCSPPFKSAFKAEVKSKGDS